MAEKNEPNAVGQKEAVEFEHIQRRLDMLDRRVDNIDSVVTAAVERLMSQPITLNITCPNCGKKIEIAIMGKEKPTV